MTSRLPMSVLLITVDCLRADHTGFMGYSRPATPFLDDLARESFVFPKAIVTGAPTYYSFPGLLASRFPLSWGREVIGIAPGEATLATVLQEAGYKTAAFIAANPYLSCRFGYEQGFDFFCDFASKAEAESTNNHGGDNAHGAFLRRINQHVANLAHKVPGLSGIYDEAYFQYCQRIASAKNDDWDTLRRFPAADVLVDQACSWLETTKRQPFFLWLHFMDPHAPYYPQSKAMHAMGVDITTQRARYLNESWKRADITPARLRKYRDEIVDLYDSGIRSVDMQLGRLVEFLRNTSLWDSCALVVTADHGEEFLDHAGVFHSPAKAYQEMLHVPLLIRMPGVQNKLSAAPFSHLHLAPTILDALGIEPPLEFEGRSYWGEVQAGAGWEIAISESVGRCTNPMDSRKRMGPRLLILQDERYKIVLHFEHGKDELYDLMLDPHELHPLTSDAEKHVRRRMLLAAQAHLQRRNRSHNFKALRATLREIGLEWSHSTKRTEILTN